MKRSLGRPFVAALLFLTLSCQSRTGAIPHGKPSPAFQEAFAAYVQDVEDAGEDIHSIMVLQHGKILGEKWWEGYGPALPHEMWSVSKTFTSMAIGLAISEGLLSLEDRVVDFFPDRLPTEASTPLKEMRVNDLLTMGSGFERDPCPQLRQSAEDWVQGILSVPVIHPGGASFKYNSACTYLLSAILTRQSGQSLADYLKPRLFDPLGIEGWTWEESPQGITCGGWGLRLKTEDMAKMGQLLLQKGVWHGKSLIPAEWITAASSRQIASHPSLESVERKGLNEENSDWMQGYGYQIWLCRHGAFRAAGAHGQFILVLPERDAVIVMTANNGKTQAQLNRVWDNLLPVL
ncbi:MAG: serine hydrolase [Bacteroidales bacterium]|nr:serine hydrolase [Bacteroidales bacterium]